MFRLRARRSRWLAYRKTLSLKSKRLRCARKGNPVNVHSTPRPPPKMTEAFEHPAGSIAARKAGGATQWRGKLLHIHRAPDCCIQKGKRKKNEKCGRGGDIGECYFKWNCAFSPKAERCVEYV